jgi:ADP-heptose:LPS heptosyltransferase
MRRRWWAFRPIDWLVALWPAKKPAPGTPGGRVLVVRMDGIGDMVLHRRALDYLPDALGVDKSDITVLGCKSWAGLADRVFQGFRVVAIDEHAYEKRWFYRLKISLWVRRQGFEVAVCDMFMRKVMTADSLVWASRAPRRIVCRPFITPRTQREWAWYLGLATQVIDTGVYPDHDGLRHFRFLSALAGREIAPQIPSLSWVAGPSPVEAGAPYVVMNFGSNEPGRRWPLAHFIALARLCREQGWRVVFVGGAILARKVAIGFTAMAAGVGLGLLFI